MDDFVRVNVAGTAHVLDACAEAGADRVVHLSSVVVYGYESPPSRTSRPFAAPTGTLTSTPSRPPTGSPAGAARW